MTTGMDGRKIVMLAQQMEIAGERAYRYCAEHADNEEVRKLFLDLADEEIEHEQFFRGLRERLQAGNAPGASLTSEQRRQMVEIATKAEGRSPIDALEEIACNASAKEMLQKALELEQTVIEFFSSMKPLLNQERDQLAVDGIIAEELRHVEALRQKLKPGTLR